MAAAQRKHGAASLSQMPQPLVGQAAEEANGL